MNILYIANERRAVQVAAHALHEIAPDVKLTWARTLSSALRWVRANPGDLGALIVEAEVQNQSCTSFVEGVRALGLTAPVVVVAPEHPGRPLETAIGDYVVSSDSLASHLPQVVNSARQRMRATAPVAPPIPEASTGHGDPDPREAVIREDLERRLQEALAAADETQRSLDTARDLFRQIESRLRSTIAHERAGRETVEAQLAAAESAREQAERRAAAEQAAAAARLTEGQSEHDAALTRATKMCTALQERLLELEAALRDADQRRESEAAASIDRLAQRHAEFTASLAQAARSRDALAQQLNAATAALDEARQTRTAEADAAAQCQAELEERLARETAARSGVEQKLTAAEAAHLDAERRETELEAALSEVVAARRALELKLVDARTAHQYAQERAETDLTAAAERQGELEERLAREAGARLAFEQKLAAAEAALQDADRYHASELRTAAARLADAEARHEAAVAHAAEARTAFEQQLAEAAAALDDAVAARGALAHTLAEAKAAHQRAGEQAAADLAAAGERHAKLEELLAQETTARLDFEEKLAAAEAARREADQRHASELTAAAARLAEVEARHDAAMSDAAAANSELEQRLVDSAAALEDSRQMRAAEAAIAAERLKKREAELSADLAEALAGRSALEQLLAKVKTAHQQAQERAAADLSAAAGRQSELEGRLAEEAAARTTLESDLAATRMESTRARRRLLDVAAAIRRRTRERKAQFLARQDQERAEHQRTLEVKEQEISRLLRAGEELRQSLHTTQEQLQRLDDTLAGERRTSEEARLATESERQRLSAEYDRTLHSLTQVSAAFTTLEQVSSEHASERARLETVVADRDAQLSAQARRLATEQAAKDALEQLQERSRQALAASTRDFAQLQAELNAVRQELQGSRAQAETLRKEADRVPHLQRQLDELQKENRHQFEAAPFAMCRCNPDGTITDANRSLVRLLGYRSPDEVRKLDFAASVFESPGDLRWLIERSVNDASSESLETTWKTRKRGRLVVRLQALVANNGLIEIVAEDITNLRAVEERLRQAHRLEAVGRLASEVAVTCDTLLRDVTRDGEQWLAAVGSDDALRQRGELLLGEVTRAASFLRQFAVYGNKQVSAEEPVSVQRVLRDLEPVLKRVAGDDIEFVLPKTSTRVDVDVDAERLERVLINVASYARERMPGGGRVKIDLTTTVVDRRFVAKYPNVRPGAHVVITVSEVRGGGRPDVPIELRGPAPVDVSQPAPGKPGVDLGVLLRLISDCGGHLWMTAEPPGNMTLRIHLPKRAPVEAIDPGAQPKSRQGRSLARLFRH